MLVRIDFDQAIDDEFVGELQKGAAYASTKLASFRVAPDRRSVTVECDAGAEAEVTAKVRGYVAAMLRSYRPLGEPEELGQTSRLDGHAIAPNAFDELVRRRWVRPLGRGQVAFAGPAAALKRYFDDAVREVARRSFAADEEDYPALVEPEVLARAGYLSSFPHSICLVSHLHEDFDAIEAFRAANADGGPLRLPDPGSVAHGDAALRPAVCLPVYRGLEGTTLPSAGLTITTSGKAFRYESRNLEGMHRLWDFSMREIVFLGAPDFVAERRERAIAATLDLVREWDFACRLVSASDPFFATVRGAKTLWQRSRAVKHEVLVDVGATTIAVGSINFAGSLFGEAFAITTADGASATTACVGFGLERLVLAAFAQHGFEAARWPRTMREVVHG